MSGTMKQTCATPVSSRRYRLPLRSVQVGGRSFVLTVCVEGSAVQKTLQRLLPGEVIGLVRLQAERAVCFRVLTREGRPYFAKLFYSRQDPQGRARLTEAVYAVCKIPFAVQCTAVCRHVYLSVCPWIDGAPLLQAGFTLSAKEKREAGRQLARLLQATHSLPLPDAYGLPSRSWRQELWSASWRLRLARAEQGRALELCRFVRRQGQVLDSRRAVCHLDVHLGNILCAPQRQDYRLIDFDAAAISHPYRELAMLFFYPAPFRPLLCSLLHTYFGGKIPAEFWRVNAVAMALYAISCPELRPDDVQTAYEVITAPRYIPAWWRVR